MIALANDRAQMGEELRRVFVRTLQSLMDDSPRVVCLEADLGGASGTTALEHSHPDQFIQCGISEANMVGVAAGLSSEGFVPYLHTFAPFATRRVFDQLYLSGAYAGNTLNVFGSDPGFCVATNGGTHTSYEDVALMRTIPGAVICDAADAVQMEWIVRAFSQMGEGVHYLRANRKAVRCVYQPGSTFEMGRGNVLRDGSDVLIISSGQLVSDALDAAEALGESGVSAAVIDMFCVKPLDSDLVLRESVGKQAVVVFENHGVVGGLGDAVAAVLAEAGAGIPLVRHGVYERFGQVGPAAFLQEEYGLTALTLVEAVRAVLARVR